MTRVAVFIDYQNCYMGARRCFDWQGNHFTYGQVYPRQLALLLVDKGRAVDTARQLAYVRPFRGEPSAKHSPNGQAAAQRQLEFWRAQQLVEPVSRPLKYYETGTDSSGVKTYRAEEKGIDVLLALGMVMGARDDEYDVAVVFTADTDIAPAVEAVLDLGKRCEVAAWSSPKRRSSRLSIPNRNVWCHWLEEREYMAVCDPTDYTRAQPGGPGGVPQEPKALAP